MAYNNNVPQANQTVASTQAPILNNFISLAPWGNGYGVFTQQNTPPTLSSGQFGLYQNANNFMILQNGTSAGINITTSSISINSGWSYLPSGILIKWGQTSALNAGSGNQQVTFPTSGIVGGTPAFNVCNMVWITPMYNSTSPSTDNDTYGSVSNIGTTSFQMQVVNRKGSGSTTATVFNWFAIGN